MILLLSNKMNRNNLKKLRENLGSLEKVRLFEKNIEKLLSPRPTLENMKEITEIAEIRTREKGRDNSNIIVYVVGINNEISSPSLYYFENLHNYGSYSLEGCLKSSHLEDILHYKKIVSVENGDFK